MKEKPSWNKGVFSYQSHQLENDDDDDDDNDCHWALDDSDDTDHDYDHGKITHKLVMKELDQHFPKTDVISQGFI